jgi:hypothetical protein
MKANNINLFQPIRVGKEIYLVITIKGNKAFIKSSSGKTKWIGINRIK